MLALLLIVYAIAYLVGERLRDFLYGEESVPEEERIHALYLALTRHGL